MTGNELRGIDLTDLDLFVDGFPHEVFTELRRRAPVWWHEPTGHTPDGVGFWVVSSHAAVVDAAADAVSFSSERAPRARGGGTLIQDLPYGSAAGVLFNMMDDPRHHEIRRVLTPALSPRALAEMEEELRARTVATLDVVCERGSCDFLLEVAVELPLQATAILLGVPEDDRHDLMAWSNATLDYEGRELGESSPAAEHAAAATAAYAANLIARKRKEGGDDMLARLCAARIRGVDGPEPLSDAELFMFFSLLIAAGSETTRNAIALGMAALIEHQDQLERLRGDRSVLPAAVEEILRWSSPTLYNRRSATRDVELGGELVHCGDKVTLWWASANRDELVFEDPFRFDISRTSNPHVAFGHRRHFCLGANLARMEIRMMLDEMLDRFCDLSLEGPIERFRTNKHAGVKHMPLSFKRLAHL